MLGSTGPRPGAAPGQFAGAARVAGDPHRRDEHRAEHHHVLIDLIDRVLAWLWAALGDVADDDIEAYRLWVAFDWVGSVIRGLLRDGLLVPEGWRKVDDIDYREWLRRHGASERTIACPLVHSYYSAVLAGALPDELDAEHQLTGREFVG